MGNLSRTALWTAAVVIICFLLAWGINRHRVKNNEPDKGSVQTITLTPANPGGDWPQFHGNRSQSGFVSGELPDQLSLLWRFKAGDEVRSSPAIVNGRVYVGSSDKHIYSIDVQTGKQVWSKALDDMIEASPTVVDNVVYIGTLNGTLYALDSESGTEQWKFSTGDKLTGGVNWFRDAHGRLYILAGSYDSVLYCIDAETGKSLWTYETGNYINGSPAVNGKHAVFGGCDAVIHIISTSDGKKTGEIDTGAYIAGSAAIKGNYAYIGNYEGELLKASLATYEVTWRYTIGNDSFISSPAVTDKAVVIGGGDMNIHCVDNQTGRSRWTYKTLDAVNSSAVIVSDKVLIGSDDGRLYLLSLADGKLLWTYETGRSITSSPAVANGMVVVGCDDGMVYCYK
ncbi:PQQ-binding-like beta-propeller repeat protein [Thermodesulfobacteriota bacterium]